MIIEKRQGHPTLTEAEATLLKASEVRVRYERAHITQCVLYGVERDVLESLGHMVLRPVVGTAVITQNAVGLVRRVVGSGVEGVRRRLAIDIMNSPKL